MIKVVGINHKTGAVAVREHLVLNVSTRETNMRIGDANMDGFLLVNTCNRIEVYISFTTENTVTKAQLIEYFFSYNHLTEAMIEEHCYFYHGDSALSHAIEVISGMDSMVIGETQVSGQIKQAYRQAVEQNTMSPALNRYFQFAFLTAKKIRSETEIGANSVSVASVAVKLALKIFSNLADRTALLIGAGDTMQLVAKYFQQQSLHQLMVVNRTQERAEMLASNYDGVAYLYEQLPDIIHKADIIITSTASRLPILGKGLIEKALAQRKYCPLFIIDLAVPRDVESGVNDLHDVYLYCIDDLIQMSELGIEERSQAFAQAREIIEDALPHWHNQQQQTNDLIRQYRQDSELIKQRELDYAIQLLTSGADAEEVLRRLAERLTNKLIHCPTDGLKQVTRTNNIELLQWSKTMLGLK